MTYVGIDNGISGGIALINEKGKVELGTLVPILISEGKKTIDTLYIYAMLGTGDRNIYDMTVTLERGAKNPLFGCKGNFSNGVYFGKIKGMLECLQINHKVITPKEWQDVIFKDMKVKGKKYDTKELSLNFVKRHHPEVSVTNHNISDAICIAHYAMLTYH